MIPLWLPADYNSGRTSPLVGRVGRDAARLHGKVSRFRGFLGNELDGGGLGLDLLVQVDDGGGVCLCLLDLQLGLNLVAEGVLRCARPG